MDVDAEEDEAEGMEEDTPKDEVEEVENQQDLTLLERFQKTLELNSPPPPPDYRHRSSSRGNKAGLCTSASWQL
jgi:hypothetical protein